MPQLRPHTAPPVPSAPVRPADARAPAGGTNPVAELQDRIRRHFAAMPAVAYPGLEAAAGRAERRDAAVASVSRLAGPALFVLTLVALVAALA